MTNKCAAMVVAAIMLLAAGCGDDGDASPFGPGDLGSSDAADDAASDLLEDLADGSLDEGDLDDLMDSAEDMMESFGGEGSGTATVNGDTIEFTSEVCFAGQGDFTLEGPGTSSDGTPVWVSISHTVESREELAEFMDDDMIDTIYGDADPIISSQVFIEYGRTEMFGESEEGLPEFDASSGTLGQSDFEMTVDGQSASGSGFARDYSGVSGDFDEMFELSFTAACS